MDSNINSNKLEICNVTCLVIFSYFGNGVKLREGILYKITNLINGKMYIGKTYSSLEERWKIHISDSKRIRENKRPLYKAIQKYGINNFAIEEIARYNSGILEDKEIEYIQKYDTYKNGYNATLGGDGKLSKNYNPDLIIKLYNIYPDVTMISKIIDADNKAIRNILKSNDIIILNGAELQLSQGEKVIYQYDDSILINIFIGYDELLKYFLDNKIGRIKKRSSLRHLIYNKGKQYGYYWKLESLKELKKREMLEFYTKYIE